jgi:hypothetical protein
MSQRPDYPDDEWAPLPQWAKILFGILLGGGIAFDAILGLSIWPVSGFAATD